MDLYDLLDNELSRLHTILSSEPEFYREDRRRIYKMLEDSFIPRLYIPLEERAKYSLSSNKEGNKK